MATEVLLTAIAIIFSVPLTQRTVFNTDEGAYCCGLHIVENESIKPKNQYVYIDKKYIRSTNILSPFCLLSYLNKISKYKIRNKTVKQFWDIKYFFRFRKFLLQRLIILKQWQLHLVTQSKLKGFVWANSDIFWPSFQCIKPSICKYICNGLIRSIFIYIFHLLKGQQ